MLRPIITEKSLTMAQKGWYTFAVDQSDRKENITAMVKQMFNVDVVNIRSIKMHGKVRRVGRSLRTIRHQDWKKALVQLKPGQKIDVFDVIPEQQPEPKK